MSIPEATGRVRVIKTPAGEAPSYIREAWVGLELPCYQVAGYLPDVELGVVSGTAITNKRMVVCVPVDDALRILEETQPAPAMWLSNQVHKRKPPVFYFTFGLDEVDLLSGVDIQQVTLVTEEMMGDPSR